MIWRPRHPSVRDCAWCGRALTGKHPPYLITKDNRIFGPYHPECADPAMFRIDPEAWKARHQPPAAIAAEEEPKK